jgi:glycosyltransferase involved in cell wall biosynthesis
MLQPFFDARTRKLLAGSSTILVAEPGARSRLRQPLSSQARLLPFGLAVDDYKVTPLPTKPRVLYLGRLDKNKRIGDLIAAFPCVQARFPEIELVIAGEGPSEGELKRQAHALGIGQATTFVGKVAHSSVPQLLSEASLLCLPSRGEPFGMVLLEAMASGRAVVATRSGGPAWIVDDGDGGRLVAPCDPAAFADALIDLFADRTRLEAAGRANRTRAEDIFDLNCILERLETLYSEAIGSSDQCGRPTRP